jgi:L-fuculose-phosphate aldolase
MSGNLSLHCKTEMLITSSGVCKGRLKDGDLVRVDLPTGASAGSGRMSSEAGMHMKIYAVCPEAKAIVHVHPPHLLALDLAGADLLDLDLFEAEQVRDKLARVGAYPPGSGALADAVASAARSAPAVYMARHGLTCWGESLDQALSLAEEAEALAQVQLLAGLGLQNTPGQRPASDSRSGSG